jgi:hypothetical protein
MKTVALCGAFLCPIWADVIKKGRFLHETAEFLVPAAVLSIQSIIADGLAFGPFHLSFQRFLAGGQKKKWTGNLGLPQEQVVRESL